MVDSEVVSEEVVSGGNFRSDLPPLAQVLADAVLWWKMRGTKWWQFGMECAPLAPQQASYHSERFWPNQPR